MVQPDQSDLCDGNHKLVAEGLYHVVASRVSKGEQIVLSRSACRWIGSSLLAIAIVQGDRYKLMGTINHVPGLSYKKKRAQFN